MQELEKIVKEINEAIERYGTNPYIDEKVTDLCYGMNIAKDIVRKHITGDPDGWVPEVRKILDKIEAEHPYKVPGNHNTYSQYNEGWQDAIDRVRGKLENLAGGWIPVEERLPEDDVDVLVTYADIDDEQYVDITITTYGYAYLGGRKLDFKEWRSPFEYFRSNYKVIAWQPLPEPYRPERSDE